MFFCLRLQTKPNYFGLSATGNQYLLWGITIQDFAL